MVKVGSEPACAGARDVCPGCAGLDRAGVGVGAGDAAATDSVVRITMGVGAGGWDDAVTGNGPGICGIPTDGF